MHKNLVCESSGHQIWAPCLSKGCIIIHSYCHINYLWIVVTPQLRRRGRREKGPATELELGAYALSQSFGHASHRSRSRSSRSIRCDHNTAHSISFKARVLSGCWIDSGTLVSSTKGRLGTEDIDQDWWLTNYDDNQLIIIIVHYIDTFKNLIQDNSLQ